MVAGAVLLVTLLGIQEPRISTTLHPERIRVGGESVLSVLVRSPAEAPRWIRFRAPEGITVVDVRRGSSTLVGGDGRLVRKEFRLRARVPGTYRLPPPVVGLGDRQVEGSRETLTVDPGPPGVTVPDPGAPGSRREESAAPAPEGEPARPGATLERARPERLPGYPWSWQWYGPEPGPIFGCGPWPWYLPFGVPGRKPRVDPPPEEGGWPGPYPPGVPGCPWWHYPGTRGWPPFGGDTARSYGYGPTPYPWMGRTPWATPPSHLRPSRGEREGAEPPLVEDDPWWVEVVPEFRSFSRWVEDPAGLLRLGTSLAPDGPVYEGQQLTLLAEVSLLPEALLRLESDPRFLPPDPQGVRVVDLPDISPGVAAAREGRVERAFTFRRAYFPVTPGRLVLPSAKVVYRPGDARRGRGRVVVDTLATEPRSVSVRPIPVERAPPGYGGAVGRFRVEVSLDREMLAVGESATLTATVSGAGYLPAVPRPVVDADPAAGLRPLSEQAFLRVRDGVVGGVKVFRWLVVPRHAGTLRIGPGILTHFDPWIGDFGVVSSREISLEVSEHPREGS